ncbi:MAG: nitroreductase family protein [bacterium]
MSNAETTSENRDALAGVNTLFVNRWSPRAFKKEPLDNKTLARVIDAARWSPSCYNEQPWRIYTSDDATFDEFASLLVDANQAWAKHASVLGLVVGKRFFSHNGKPNPTFEFDCGAAWMALTLQARFEGLYTHGMAGLHYDAAAEYLKIDPDNEKVIMGFALGKMGDPSSLNETLREKESPSGRRPLDEIWNP